MNLKYLNFYLKSQAIHKRENVIGSNNENKNNNPIIK